MVNPALLGSANQAEQHKAMTASSLGCTQLELLTLAYFRSTEMSIERLAYLLHKMDELGA